MIFRGSIQVFIKDEQGAELAEYAVGVALLAAIAVIVYTALGDAINDSQTGTAAKVTSATWTAP
jgi:Flp pilus assembly pilin Flp